MTIKSSNIKFAKDIVVGDTLLFKGEDVKIVEIHPYEKDQSLYLRFEEGYVTDKLNQKGYFCSRFEAFAILN